VNELAGRASIWTRSKTISRSSAQGRWVPPRMIGRPDALGGRAPPRTSHRARLARSAGPAHQRPPGRAPSLAEPGSGRPSLAAAAGFSAPAQTGRRLFTPGGHLLGRGLLPAGRLASAGALVRLARVPARGLALLAWVCGSLLGSPRAGILGGRPRSQQYESFTFAILGWSWWRHLRSRLQDGLAGLGAAVLGFIFMVWRTRPRFSKPNHAVDAALIDWLTYHVVVIMLSYSPSRFRFSSAWCITQGRLGGDAATAGWAAPPASSARWTSSFKIIAVGFPLLTLGIITGGLGRHAWGRHGASTPRNWSAITWLVYAIYLPVRYLGAGAAGAPRSCPGRLLLRASLILVSLSKLPIPSLPQYVSGDNKPEVWFIDPDLRDQTKRSLS